MIIYIVFWALSLGVSSFIRKPSHQFLFLAVVFVFIGFRYETGFDWPAYKDQFAYLSGGFSLAKVKYFSETFQQEIGFVIITAISAQILPSYEIFQAIITALFLGSTVLICSTFRVKNYALVLSIALAYLLLTLAFSTLRQCLAMSMFNFGVAFFLQKKYARSTPLFILAVTTQVSSLLYIAAFAYAVIRPRSVPAARNAIGLLVAALAVIAALPLLQNYLPGYFVERIIFYNMTASVSAISLWQIYFVLVFIFIGGFALFTRTDNDMIDYRTNVLRRLVLALAIISSCSFFINIVRDRASYELFLLFSIYIVSTGLPYVRLVRAATACLGLIFSLLNVLSPSTRIVFTPYQNYIVSLMTGEKGDARLRQELFDSEFRRTF